MKHRQLQDDGSTKTTETSFDALDRTSSKVEGTKTTNYSYLGLSGEVLSEEVAGEITASYQYSPWGSRLSQVKFEPDGTSEDSYYGYNPHSDVETLTSDAGDARSTYGYTAYGKDDEERFTGADKPDAQNPGKEPCNVYRFNAKRWDQSSQSYDMGFRNYSPGLNRFLTRDAYNGALSDLNLSTDPWNANRYAFAGGNPISRIEYDGHLNIEEGYGGGKYGAMLELCPTYHVELNPSGGDPLVVGTPPKDPTGEVVKTLGHVSLDVVGLAPGVGEYADGLNCGWYALEAEAGNAAASCLGAVPVTGWGATLAKWSRAFKGGDEAESVWKQHFKDRGLAIEAQLGGNLPTNFPPSSRSWLSAGWRGRWRCWASAKLTVLGADGYPDVPFLTASVVRYPEQSDWVVLRCDGSTRRDASAEEARADRRLWADFLRDHAERTAAGFAYLSDEADFAGPRTALELSLGLFRRRRSACSTAS